ncbi:MAG: hypothetical protein F4186_00985 [Boseongicola sp. SB0676_bin_33]|nr:hypothetical protein [Boseongicola sp. SB0676_bin_33]
MQAGHGPTNGNSLGWQARDAVLHGTRQRRRQWTAALPPRPNRRRSARWQAGRQRCPARSPGPPAQGPRSRSRPPTRQSAGRCRPRPPSRPPSRSPPISRYRSLPLPFAWPWPGIRWTPRRPVPRPGSAGTRPAGAGLPRPRPGAGASKRPCCRSTASGWSRDDAPRRPWHGRQIGFPQRVRFSQRDPGRMSPMVWNSSKARLQASMSLLTSAMWTVLGRDYGTGIAP